MNKKAPKGAFFIESILLFESHHSKKGSDGVLMTRNSIKSTLNMLAFLKKAR